MNDDDGSGCGTYATMPVGSKPDGASPYGALDMAGNVWERVADWFDPTYYEESPSESPQGPDTGSYRSHRGGGFGDPAMEQRASFRNTYAPDYGCNDVGFRCAADMPR